MLDRRVEFRRSLADHFKWDPTSKIWWDKSLESEEQWEKRLATRENPKNYDGAARLELYREKYEDELLIYNNVDETTIEHDLAKKPFTPRVAANYHIHLNSERLDLMIDMVWGFGRVVYWPSAPEEQYGTWEVL